MPIAVVAAVDFALTEGQLAAALVALVLAFLVMGWVTLGRTAKDE